MRICSVEGCGKKCQCKGFCGMHYTRVFRYGDPNCKNTPGPKAIECCSIPGCGKKHRGLGLCSLHYYRQRGHGDPNYTPGPRDPRTDGETRQCKKCRILKPLEKFPKNPKCSVGRLHVCKLCQEERRLERLLLDPELRILTRIKKRQKYHKDVEKSRAYNKSFKTPEKLRKQRLKGVYGLTEEDYQKLFKSQNGVCAICKQPETRKNWPLSVDHDHRTGKVRGLLCSFCNPGIGMLKDSVALLSTAIEYLKRAESDSGAE